MTAIYSNGGNRWNILDFNFTKRDALSSLYKISMIMMYYVLGQGQTSSFSCTEPNANEVKQRT
jgi:hypothetical protein